MKPCHPLRAILETERQGKDWICRLVCGHTVTIRVQGHVTKRTRCTACPSVTRDARWSMPRPFCQCGCGRRVPLGNRAYFESACWRQAHPGIFSTLAGKAACKAWKPGGGNYEAYRVRVLQRLQALVPDQETFTRDEVLRIAYRARVDGYRTAESTVRERYLRTGAA